MENLTYITGNYGKYVSVKEKFENAKDWAMEELKKYYIAYINGDINDTNKEYVSVLRKCDTWEEALEIANNWII